MTIPNGFWQWDTGAQMYAPSHYVTSDAFAWDSAFVSSHPSYSTIGIENVANFLDPTYGGDSALRARNMMMEFGAQQACFDYQQSAGMNWFDISGTGFI